MLFTLLYSSSLLRENPHRNIYLYAIGVIIYIIIHYLLFSFLSEHLDVIRKYRNFIYGFALCDMMYVKHKYDEFMRISPKINTKNKKPIIEEVKDDGHIGNTRNDAVFKNDSYANDDSGQQLNKSHNTNPESTPQIPTYIPQYQLTQTSHNPPHQTEEIGEIPIYSP